MADQDPADGSRSHTAPADLDPRRARLLAGLLALAGAAIVGVVAWEVFPFHSTNHDEGVYLQQAAMLLDGQLLLRPPVEDAFRPWFFVDAESPAGPAAPVPEVAGDVLYPKYAPVPAALFALGMALGDPRLSLVLVAAALVGLTYALGAEVFDRRRGVLAAALLLGSPLFVLDASVFLPYAPTALFTFLFAWAYLRADRLGAEGLDDDARRWAVVAGLAIGAAFFARPFTAVLFAAPFVVHALWSMRRGLAGLRVGDRSAVAVDTRPLVRQWLVAAGGLLGVAVALGYNAAVTGRPLVFPYAAFAPLDGVGFGERAILGYERDFTPALALRANAEVLWLLATRWVVAGPLGTLAAAVGLGAALWPLVGRHSGRPADRGNRPADRGSCPADRGSRPADRGNRPADPRHLVLAGLVPSVAIGNLLFWGNLNLVGALDVAGDGLVAFLGPYYHFDLLLPVAVFGAHGLLVAAGRLHGVVSTRFDPGRAGRVGVATLLVASAAFGGVAALAVAEPVVANDRVGDNLAAAYEPVVEREFENAVVFLPTPYGPWLNHPLQALRNDPGYGGDVVYALGERQFDVVDAFPDRALYRYTYRGQWAPFLGDAVEPRLQRVRHVRAESVAVDARLGLPPAAQSVSLRLAAGDEATSYVATADGDELPIRLVLGNGTARVEGAVRAVGAGNGTVPLEGRETVRLTVFVDTAGTSGFSYVLRVPVDREGGAVRALTPSVEVCTRPRLCGGEQAYVPGSHRDGISVEVSLRAVEEG